MNDAESDDGSAANGLDLFQEPRDYFRPEEQATFVDFALRNGQELHLRLVGRNPLWV